MGVTWSAQAASGATFILCYAGLVALSVQGGVRRSPADSFGPWLGSAYAVVGATTGATVVFAARAGLADLATRRPWVQRIEAGFRRTGSITSWCCGHSDLPFCWSTW
jgi:uncharacterized membrane protein YdjX (TVP38/TMEM64 family)